ncbi:Protein D7 [Operophtera brumata]|uniref:Protein D7 n=1 Tax=Operophtera brumata TaxID=104452 RepID=A0A0L7KXF1_OPEBR|nr:Protein D7 [Operophtera brumata]
MCEPKPRQLMTCPYNKAHQVEQYRMHIHLQKCRKQYPNEAVSVCPFDATHIIRDVEMDYHVRTCPKRILMDSQIYITDDDHCPVTEALSAPVAQPDTTSSENWDDVSTASYLIPTL